MNRRTLILTILLVISLLFLFVVQMRFSGMIETGTKAEKTFLAQQIIASDIRSKIDRIESLSYKIPLIANRSKLLQVYMLKLEETIHEMKALIDLLQTGGTYTTRISLNLAGRDAYAKNYYLPAPDHLSTKVIRLKPRIMLFEKMTYKLNHLVNQKIDAKQHGRPLQTLGSQISLFAKSLDSIFRRMKEDANQLYFDAQVKHTAILKQVERRKTRYNYVTFATLTIILILFLLLLRTFIQELRHKLYYDRLTGLSSRARLEETDFSDSSLLLLVDLDDFSDINSLYGMSFGDKILRNQADKLRHFDAKAKSFRVAGDIFGIYYPTFPDDDTLIEEKIDAIRSHLKDCSKCNMEISVTIGAAKGSDCLHDAYMALDIANTKGEPGWIYHDESTYIREVKFNRLWHDELKAALDNDTIVPFFHPIVNKDKEVIHYETLMRLKRSNGKTEYISPSVFLDVAKKTKLYLPISRRLIEKAFVFFSDKPDISFTINLSYEDMEKEPIQAFLKEMVETYHAAGRVVFEVLETSFIDNPDLLEEFIAHFRAMGVKFAIDDFGAGYSNLKRVVALNPDYLKIDGSLIQAMLHDKRSHKMVENIVEYAREFGIKTVAEYVSTPELFAECQRMNMDYCQGYYFAEPSPQLEL